MNEEEMTAHGAAAVRQTPEYRRILVGTDGSACSARAASHAIYLAQNLGAKLYVLYAVNVERAFHAGIHFGEAVAELEEFGKNAVGAVMAEAAEKGVECVEILLRGRPHRAIIEVSDEIGADLVIVGSTGMTALERTLLGSESERVLRHCKRPVLLVHEP